MIPSWYNILLPVMDDKVGGDKIDTRLEDGSTSQQHFNHTLNTIAQILIWNNEDLTRITNTLKEFVEKFNPNTDDPIYSSYNKFRNQVLIWLNGPKDKAGLIKILKEFVHGKLDLSKEDPLNEAIQMKLAQYIQELDIIYSQYKANPVIYRFMLEEKIIDIRKVIREYMQTQSDIVRTQFRGINIALDSKDLHTAYAHTSSILKRMVTTEG